MGFNSGNNESTLAFALKFLAISVFFSYLRKPNLNYRLNYRIHIIKVLNTNTTSQQLCVTSNWLPMKTEFYCVESRFSIDWMRGMYWPLIFNAYWLSFNFFLYHHAPWTNRSIVEENLTAYKKQTLCVLIQFWRNEVIAIFFLRKQYYGRLNFTSWSVWYPYRLCLIHRAWITLNSTCFRTFYAQSLTTLVFLPSVNNFHSKASQAASWPKKEWSRTKKEPVTWRTTEPLRRCASDRVKLH